MTAPMEAGPMPRGMARGTTLMSPSLPAVTSFAVIVHKGNGGKKKQHARANAKGVQGKAEKRKQVRPEQKKRHADTEDGRGGLAATAAFACDQRCGCR